MNIAYIFRLILLLLSESGYYRLLLPRMKTCRSAIPFWVLCSQGLLIFFAGLLGIMLPMVYLLFGGGFAALILSLILRFRIHTEIPAGMWVLLALILYGVWITYDHRFWFCDDFYHWATICKVLLKTDALTCNGSIVTFTSYPPGAACLIYYVCRIVTGQNICEWGMMLTQAVFISTAIIPLLSVGKTPLQKIISYIGFALVLLESLTGSVQRTNLMVDAVMPAMAVAMLCMIFQSSSDTPVWFLLPPLAFLMLIKSNAVFFALWVIAAWLVCCRHGKKTDWRKVLLLILSLCVILIWRYWANRHISGAMTSKHSFSKRKLFENFAMSSGQTILDIIHLVTASIKKQYAIHVLTLLPFAFLVIGKRQRTPLEKGFPWIGIGGWCVWHLGVYFVYLFSMHYTEALQMAAFGRYENSLRPLLIAMLTLIAVSAVEKVTLSTVRKKTAAAVILCAATAAVLLLLQPKYNLLLPQAKTSDRRIRMESLLAQCEPTEGQSVLIAAQDPEATCCDTPMAKYLLFSDHVVVADSFEADAGYYTDQWYEEHAPGYDYLWLMEPRPEALRYVQKHCPDQIGQDVVWLRERQQP